MGKTSMATEVCYRFGQTSEIFVKKCFSLRYVASSLRHGCNEPSSVLAGFDYSFKGEQMIFAK